MKRVLFAFVLLLAVAGCSKPEVVYRIPPEKQDAAAAMMMELVKHASINTGYYPGTVFESARREVEHIYGEPVIPTKP